MFVLAVLCGGVAGPLRAEGEISLMSPGIVSEITNSDGWACITLARLDQRFCLRIDSVQDAGGLAAALRDSYDTGQRVYVTHLASSGWFENSAGLPTYAVQRVEYKGSTYTVEPRLPRQAKVKRKSEADLALAVAYGISDKPQEAIALLDQAISRRELSTSLQAVALKARGRVTVELAMADDEEPNLSDDKAILRALEDFRAWAKLEPDTADAQFSIANALVELGAYDEAIETYRAIAKRWADEQFWPAIRIGAIYRTLGDYPRALASLDDFAASSKPPYGMAFHYHRGWTLILMERFQDAIDQFTTGLQGQPDYHWASVRRACAYARLGRLEEALADQRLAIDGLDSVIAAGVQTAGIELDRKRMMEVASELAAAIDAGKSSPMTAPCDGYRDYGETRRERSSLLTD